MTRTQRMTILDLVRARKAVTVQAIMEDTGFGWNSVTPALLGLEREGLVRREGYTWSKSGRRAALYVPVEQDSPRPDSPGQMGMGF